MSTILQRPKTTPERIFDENAQGWASHGADRFQFMEPTTQGSVYRHPFGTTLGPGSSGAMWRYAGWPSFRYYKQTTDRHIRAQVQSPSDIVFGQEPDSSKIHDADDGTELLFACQSMVLP